MERDISSLADSEFDLLVVGAGVYGAAAAWDAALRGLAVALVDKGDFGGETSFNNFKTIHGGLRYLQHGDWRRMRESIRERRALLRIAPHLVHPQPFLMPTYRGSLRNRSLMRVALLLNDLVSLDRNRSLADDKRLSGGRMVSRNECLTLAPGLLEEGLTGGALWFDAMMPNSDRMTLAYVLSAARAGARVANHVEVNGLRQEEHRVRGARVTDRLGGERFEIRARTVLNAAGPWVDQLVAMGERPSRSRLFHFSKAMNIVTRPIVDRVALGVTGVSPHRGRDTIFETGKRLLFLLPWRGLTLIGTAHLPHRGAPEDLSCTDEEIEMLLQDVNRAYPAAGLRRQDVRFVHCGLLPMRPGNARANGITLEKRYALRDHGMEGLPGLLSMVGVKYTTARDVAEKAIDRIFALLGRPAPPCRTATTPVLGGEMECFSDLVSRALRERPATVDAEAMRHLVYTYGNEYGKVLQLVEKNASWGQRVTAGSAVIRAELLHAAREEQAVDLASAVLRRTELGSAGHPGRPALETAASIMAGELGWDDARVRSEIEGIEAIYRSRS